MAKVIIKNLAKSVLKRSRIAEKRVVNPDGKVVRIPTIDSNSPHFSSELRLLFQRNVAKARRENKKRFGSADRVSEKA
jgi:hypothetical protein